MNRTQDLDSHTHTHTCATLATLCSHATHLYGYEIIIQPMIRGHQYTQMLLQQLERYVRSSFIVPLLPGFNQRVSINSPDEQENMAKEIHTTFFCFAQRSVKYVFIYVFRLLFHSTQAKSCTEMT